MNKKYRMITGICIVYILGAMIPMGEHNYVNAASVQNEKNVKTDTDNSKGKSVSGNTSLKNVGVSNTINYLNIRKTPDLQGTIVGKLHRGSVAKIVKTKGDWIKVNSNGVKGYVSKPYLSTGAEAKKILMECGSPVANVTADTLRVRESKSIDSKVLGLVAKGDKLKVISQGKEWTKVKYNKKKAYLSNDYVQISYTFEYAIPVKSGQGSTDEKKPETSKPDTNSGSSTNKPDTDANKPAIDTDKPSADKNNTTNKPSADKDNSTNKPSADKNNSADTPSDDLNNSTNNPSVDNNNSADQSGADNDATNQPGSDNSTTIQPGLDNNGTTPPPTVDNDGSITLPGVGDNNQLQQPGLDPNNPTVDPSLDSNYPGNKIVAYAMQFLGNPYVSGGTSLTQGADCSGFVQTVFKDCGYSVPRTSREQALAGIPMNEIEMLPGDIVSYAYNGTVNHVGIYVGNNQMIHASNPTDGIKLTKYNYRAVYSIRRIVQ